MAVRAFQSFADEKISIAGREFPFRPLPSGKALKFSELIGDPEKLLEQLSEGLEEDTTTLDTFKSVGSKVLDARYKLFSYALGIEEGSEEGQQLKEAIDEASFRELTWVTDQLLEVNGIKHIESLVKNSLSRLESLVPDLRDGITAYLKRSSQTQNLMDRLDKLRSIGSIQSSEPSEENPTT